MAAVIADQEDGENEEHSKETIDAEAFHDHVNGGKIDATKVRKAREEEMIYFRKCMYTTRRLAAYVPTRRRNRSE